MLTMSQINDIRDLGKSGYGITQIHAKTGVDPKTIRKYLAKDDFSPVPPKESSRDTLLSPYLKVIREWLDEDCKTWQKQRHTAKRIYDRLKTEYNYQGSYDTVRRKVKGLRVEVQTKGSQELVWEPGNAQADFGEADFHEDTETVRRKYLTLSFPYSNDGFSQVFCGETAECVCEGLKAIFEYVGGVPKLIVFDNATGVGHRFFDKVIETELFSRFRAHYGFQIRFCNPRAGYEKGSVENKVGTNRRNLFVPVPTYHDIEEFNRSLLDRHKVKAEEDHYKKGVPISSLFEEDRKAFLPLPYKPFNVCRYERFKANGYGNICMEGKHFYSTKPENHGKEVLVGIRAHYIDILEDSGKLLVRHRRQYGDTRTDILDYSTSLEMLSKNIGAWDNSGYRREAPDALRLYIDSQDKLKRKTCIKLLSDLSNQYGYPTALNAIQMAIQTGSVNVSSIAVLAARMAGYGLDTPPESGPSLSVYDQAFLPKENEVTA